MTAKQRRDKVFKMVDKWQTKLGLDNWEVIVYFEDYGKKNKKYKNSYYSVVATTLTNHQYKLGSIYFNPKDLDIIDEGVVVHELLHLLISPLAETARKVSKNKEDADYFTEQLTSELERIILRVQK